MLSEHPATLLHYVAGYVVGSLLVLRGPWFLARLSGREDAQLRPSPLQSLLFATLNLAACYVVFFHDAETGAVTFGLYMLAVIGHWMLVQRYVSASCQDEWLYWIVFAYPIIALVVLKSSDSWMSVVGLSYMAFRLSFLATELRFDPALKLSAGDYFAFAFFLPTLSVGPISRYTSFATSLAENNLTPHNLFHGAVRVVVGFLKFKVVANYLYLLTFSSLWKDGFEHTAGEFALSCVAYYAYLYANFSGACDVAVGAAAMAGIRVDENFDAPWRARNLQEFWTRWHMTLSAYLRDIFYTPVSMLLLRLCGPCWGIHSTALAAFVTMLLIGAWHGFDPGYLAFGMAQGVGMAAVYYWDWLLQKLPRPLRTRYRASGSLRLLAAILTHSYIALTLFFFENHTAAQMQQVLSVLRW